MAGSDAELYHAAPCMATSPLCKMVSSWLRLEEGSLIMTIKFTVTTSYVITQIVQDSSGSGQGFCAEDEGDCEKVSLPLGGNNQSRTWLNVSFLLSTSATSLRDIPAVYCWLIKSSIHNTGGICNSCCTVSYK